MVGHVICQVDQSDKGSLKVPNPEVLHKSAITMLSHVHHHKQNLTHKHTQKSDAPEHHNKTDLLFRDTNEGTLWGAVWDGDPRSEEKTYWPVLTFKQPLYDRASAKCKNALNSNRGKIKQPMCCIPTFYSGNGLDHLSVTECSQIAYKTLIKNCFQL